MPGVMASDLRKKLAMLESHKIRQLAIGLVLAFTILDEAAIAQTLPGNVSCRDLLDIASGRLSRSIDGGRTYIAIKTPQPRDPFEKALMDYDTHLCHRAAKREINSHQFNALHEEKSRHLEAERQKSLAQQRKLEFERKASQDRQAAREIHKEALPVEPSGQPAKKSASHVLLVPAHAQQSRLLDYEKRLAEWRIVERYDNYMECESAKTLIVGLSHENNRATSEAFRVGVCVGVEELERVKRNH
jgi:hypothetical protein